MKIMTNVVMNVNHQEDVKLNILDLHVVAQHWDPVSLPCLEVPALELHQNV